MLPFFCMVSLKFGILYIHTYIHVCIKLNWREITENVNLYKQQIFALKYTLLRKIQSPQI